MAAVDNNDLIHLTSLRTSFCANTNPATNWYNETLLGSLRDYYGGNRTDITSDDNGAHEESRKEEIIDDVLNQIETRGYRFVCSGTPLNQVIENTPGTYKIRKQKIKQSSREMLRRLASDEMNTIQANSNNARGIFQRIHPTRSVQTQSRTVTSHGEWSELLRRTIASETRDMRRQGVKDFVVDWKFGREVSLSQRQIQREIRREVRRENSLKKSESGRHFVPCGRNNDVIESE